MLIRTRTIVGGLAGCAAAILVAACGGRISRPVAATEPYDARLDCAHITAEKTVNAARARDLAGEQHNDANNNMGFLVFSPLFLNLSGSEQTEMTAFAAREVTLNHLAAEKCPIPAITTVAP